MIRSIAGFEEIKVGLIEQLINAKRGTLHSGQSKQHYPYVFPVTAFDQVYLVDRDAGDRGIQGQLHIRQAGQEAPIFKSF